MLRLVDEQIMKVQRKDPGAHIVSYMKPSFEIDRIADPYWSPMSFSQEVLGARHT